MISVAEAEERILTALKPMPLEQVVITDSFGRVVGEDVKSRRTQPPMAVSAMDGYAVRAADVQIVPTDLKVVGYAPAGGSYDAIVREGETVRIYTGAPVPAGADAIVIQENTAQTDDSVRINEGATAGTFVRPAGLDFAEGDVLIPTGTRMTARHVGLAAAMNVPWLMTYRKPRVAILATGDEIVMPGQEIGPNQIVSSNAIALAAFVRAMGAEPVLLGIAPDDREGLRQMASGIVGNDMLVTTGGASVGDHDLVQDVLSEGGMEVNFWRIAMRPGKPLMFGDIRGIPVLGLPGNPVSSLVCAMIFLRPAIARMQGSIEADRDTLSLKIADNLPTNDRRQDYLRATFETDDSGDTLVRSFHRQDSSMMATLTHADGLIVRPPHAPALSAGERVEVLKMPSGVFRT
ncbi:MAG: gephyrin-like molybdotransferase Glp [Alphaproteobacteria bacterium]